jgi:hypothetical protein
MIFRIKFHINISQFIVTEITNTFFCDISILLRNLTAERHNLKHELKHIHKYGPYGLRWASFCNSKSIT